MINFGKYLVTRKKPRHLWFLLTFLLQVLLTPSTSAYALDIVKYDFRFLSKIFGERDITSGLNGVQGALRDVRGSDYGDCLMEYGEWLMAVFCKGKGSNKLYVRDLINLGETPNFEVYDFVDNHVREMVPLSVI